MNKLLLLVTTLLLGSLHTVVQAATDLQHQPVTAGALCASDAPEEAAPACATMQEAMGQAMQACEGEGADARFCAVMGGNIYGLVQGCYLYGKELHADSRRPCKAVDTFVSAAAAYCRLFSTDHPRICALAQSDEISEGQIQRYQASWLHRAHVLQRELSASQKMRDTMYPSSHNSYNITTENNPPTVSGSDANQFYAIPAQLDMDIRAIELDLHWVPSPQDGRFRATICHGSSMHAGCSYEHSLAEELQGLRAWLDANPGEVIIIDIEDNMSHEPDSHTGADRYPEASATLYEALGDLLFLPGQGFGNGDTAPACGEGQPLEATSLDLRTSGKQVITYSSCNFVHQDVALTFSRDSTHLQTGPGSYAGIQALDNCGFTPDQIAGQFVRFYEDGTLVGSSSGAAAPATLDEVRAMARCNINMPSLDHIQPFDGRLEALLWSWDQEQPDAQLLDQAGGQPLLTFSNAAGRFEIDTLPAVRKRIKSRACKNPRAPLAVDGRFNTQRWVIAQQCAAPFEFAVPQNGADNELLKAAKQQAGVEEAEVNLRYSARQGWDWPGR